MTKLFSRLPVHLNIRAYAQLAQIELWKLSLVLLLPLISHQRVSYKAKCRSDIDDNDDISDKSSNYLNSKFHCEIEESEEFCEYSAFRSLRTTIIDLVTCDWNELSESPRSHPIFM